MSPVEIVVVLAVAVVSLLLRLSASVLKAADDQTWPRELTWARSPYAGLERLGPWPGLGLLEEVREDFPNLTPAQQYAVAVARRRLFDALASQDESW